MKLPKTATIYYACISLLGVLILGIGIANTSRILLERNQTTAILLVFYLFYFLTANFTTVSLPSSGGSVAVSTAFAIAAISLFDPYTAGAMAGIGYMFSWRNYKLSGATSSVPKIIVMRRMFFSMNALVISLSAGGGVYVLIQQLFQTHGSTWWGKFIGIAGAGITANQVSLWTVIFIVLLTSDTPLSEIWSAYRWSVPIDLMVNIIGGNLLGFTATHYGVVGALFFTLPVVVSAYTYNLTVNNSKKYITQLEHEVAERTTELRQINAQLKQLDHLKDEFLDHITHELKTPLNAIIGFASYLQEDIAGMIATDEYTAPTPDELIELVEDTRFIKEAGYSLLAMITDLLDMSRISAGKMSVHIQPITPYDLLKSTEKMMRGYLAQKGKADTIEFQCALDVSRNLPPIAVDPKRTEQILFNLLSNAVKFTETGAIGLQASLEPPPNGNHVRFVISDTGEGIEPEKLPTLFEKFTRLDATSNKEGAGLGLPIARELTQLQHGDITATSELGKGTTFTVTLPVWVNDGEGA